MIRPPPTSSRTDTPSPVPTLLPSLYRPFVEGVVETTRGYVLGDPLDERTTLGPMVRARAADFIRGQVEAALRAGAEAHIDPRAFPRNAAGTPYIAPQVLPVVAHTLSNWNSVGHGESASVRCRIRGAAVP